MEARSGLGRFAGGLSALLIVALGTAGCGHAGSTVTVSPRSSGSPAAASTALSIVVNEGAGKTDTWSLTCNPAGGSHPDPTAACRALASGGKVALPPVAKGMMCSQIFGGGQTARITGTWIGVPVNARFSRVNGCEVTRWQALVGLLPATRGAAG